MNKKYLDYLRNLQENRHLTEMSVLRKDRTKLPVNIFVDDMGSWKKSGHANRIKFQADKGNKPNSRTMIPMSISDNPKVLVDSPYMELSVADINKIKQFVKNNKEILIKLGNNDIDIFEFRDLMII